MRWGSVRLWTASRGQKREARVAWQTLLGPVGAPDLSGKPGSAIFTALTVRVPLVLTAGSKACHEVPRGGTGTQAGD